MKKTTMILIGIIYVASIVIISIFGLKSVVYNEVIPVTEITCLNETDEKTEVSVQNGQKIIKIKYTEPGDEETLTGTMVQLSWRTLPDNASNKDVKFVYNTSQDVATFIKDEQGKELGLILFTGKVMLNIKIMATDGSKVYTDVIVWAY